MNVSLSSRHAVHATHGVSLKCGSRSANGLESTSREVTCKKCVKALAAEAEAEARYQDRLAASMAPATESDDLGYVAPAGAEADQPAEIIAIREDAEHAADAARVDAAILRLTARLAEPTEANDRPAVWMVQQQGRTLWAAKSTQGLYTTKARATAAQERAESLAALRRTEAAQPRRAYRSLRRLLDLNG